MSHVIKSFEELTVDQESGAGGKGGALARLHQAGFPVPDGFVIMPAAFVEDTLAAEAWAEVQEHLAPMRATDPEMAFAVRSSAMAEDSAEASFAGEFETVLNVHTDEEIYAAIQAVYDSRASERVRVYTEARGGGEGPPGGHQIAVIVQELVKAESSGVLFTADPITGRRDRAIISAAWGVGEAVVGGLVTPDTLTVDTATGHVIDRETADKQVMTVLLASGTQEQPTPGAMRREPVLSGDQAAELVRMGNLIEATYDRPMDIEWAWAERLYILQARPITALPPDPAAEGEGEPPVPTEWKLPEGSYVGMRNNIVELMAGPLTPLFGTLGRSAVNTSFRRLLTQFFGRPGIAPDEIILTVNQYAYYNGSLRAGQMARILLGSVGIMKRMMSGAVERWTDEGRPRYVTRVEAWQATQWRELSSVALLDAVRELSEAAIDAYGALVSGVIPAAWMSEALFTMVYRTLIKRRNDPPASTFLLGFDSVPIQAEKALHDLARWTSGREGLATYLKGTPAIQLAAQFDVGQTPPGVEQGDWQEWQSRFQAHLAQYGHTIYDLDFANPVPADDPAPLLNLHKDFLGGQGADPLNRTGTDPRRRQQASTERREQAMRATIQRLGGLRLRLFRKLVAPAQRFAPLREDGLADVGLSYPLLRAMLRELGRRLVGGGMIDVADDIFWLMEDEAREAAAKLDLGQELSSLAAEISGRKATWRAARRATPPMMLPQIRILGMDIEEVKAARASKRNGHTLKGVATSAGRVTATARVLHGPEDFDQMQSGDVLVAAVTTPAWTPLFARAAAVVTDVGGPLSHGSIVAREYGIPAVLGTGTATKRIRSGQMITVDGSEGKVYLEAGDQPPA